MNQPNDLPKELLDVLKTVISVFNQNDIQYWLGGGLFQLISQNKFDSISQNFKGHDIDFHILASQSETTYNSLQSCSELTNLGIYPSENKNIKIAFKINELDVEAPFLFDSPEDSNVYFFVSWGKKENWPLTENERQRFYYFSVPKEIFSSDTFKLDDLVVKIPTVEYVKLLYK